MFFRGKMHILSFLLPNMFKNKASFFGEGVNEGYFFRFWPPMFYYLLLPLGNKKEYHLVYTMLKHTRVTQLIPSYILCMSQERYMGYITASRN